MTAIERQNLQMPVHFDSDQIGLIKDQIAPKATDGELALFVEQCKRTGLDPFSKQIYAIHRWDSQARKERMTIQTSIDGLRLIAERTGKYAGQLGPFFCGPDGVWVDVWLKDTPPLAARVGVLKIGFAEPLYRVVKLSQFMQTTKEGKPSGLWARMPDVMLAKCAESQALRAAFPNDMSGLYTDAEMSQADSEAVTVQATVQQEMKADAEVLTGWQRKLDKLAHAARTRTAAPHNEIDRIMTEAQGADAAGLEAACNAMTALGKAHPLKPAEEVVDAELTEAPVETFGKDLAAQYHKHLGAMLKGSDYPDTKSFISEALGRDIEHLSEVPKSEKAKLDAFIKDYKDTMEEGA